MITSGPPAPCRRSTSAARHSSTALVDSGCRRSTAPSGCSASRPRSSLDRASAHGTGRLAMRRHEPSPRRSARHVRSGALRAQVRDTMPAQRAGWPSGMGARRTRRPPSQASTATRAGASSRSMKAGLFTSALESNTRDTLRIGNPAFPRRYEHLPAGGNARDGDVSMADEWHVPCVLAPGLSANRTNHSTAVQLAIRIRS